MKESGTPPTAPLAYSAGGDRDSLGVLTVSEAAILAVRLLGLYCLLYALPLLSVIAMVFYAMRTGAGSSGEQLLMQLSYPLVYAAAGVLLLTKSSWVARRVLGVASWVGEPPLRLPAQNLQAIALSIFGVILVVAGVESFIRAAALSFRAGRVGDLVINGVHLYVGELAVSVFKLAAGIWLFLGSKRLANYWRRIRMSETAAIPARAADDIDNASDVRQ